MHASKQRARRSIEQNRDTRSTYRLVVGSAVPVGEHEEHACQTRRATADSTTRARHLVQQNKSLCSDESAILASLKVCISTAPHEEQHEDVKPLDENDLLINLPIVPLTHEVGKSRSSKLIQKALFNKKNESVSPDSRSPETAKVRPPRDARALISSKPIPARKMLRRSESTAAGAQGASG
eukprot:6062601-Pleurochrysis_carterae.AAC.1